MKVKICGITTKETALAACEAGADMLGFVFAESSRKIDLDQAKDIIRQLPENVASVGVFVNESIENIQQIAKTAQLDYIQLHGDETPDFCEQLPLPTIKAFTIREEDDVHQMASFNCAYYLVDSPGIKYRGGSGQPFNWSLLKNGNIEKEKMILAGGLNEENIGNAIKQVQPAAVDVSSGVETDGKKDKQKISAFIKAAKSI